MLTVLISRTLDDFADYLCGEDTDDSFHENLARVKSWLDKLSSTVSYPLPASLMSKDKIWTMLAREPGSRPSALHLDEFFSMLPACGNDQPCCDLGPESYMA